MNTRPEAELADILFHLGEERFARRIAKAIVERRAEQPFTTTGDLAALVRSKSRATPRASTARPVRSRRCASQ